jgi:hypothetical protein
VRKRQYLLIQEWVADVPPVLSKVFLMERNQPVEVLKRSQLVADFGLIVIHNFYITISKSEKNFELTDEENKKSTNISCAVNAMILNLYSFDIGSQATFATVIGLLIEVPVRIVLVNITSNLQTRLFMDVWYVTIVSFSRFC